MRVESKRTAAAMMMLAMAMLAGCKSKEDAALDAAKKQAAATGQAQQFSTYAKDGTVTTTTVQPPAPGQTAEAVTTMVTPPAGVPPGTAAVTPGTPAVAPGTPAVAPGAPGQATSAGQGYGPGYGQGQPAPYAQGYGQGQPAGGAPVVRPADVSIPAGTPLTIRINQHISVKTARAGDRFDGEMEEPVAGDNNQVVIPRGAPVMGVVAEAHRRGHFKGASILELRLTSLTLNGTRYRLDTSDLTRTKKGKGRRTAAFIGGGSGLGMLVGGVATGGVGLLVGGLAGAGAGTAIGGLTGNRDIEIPAESIVRFRLADNLVVQAP